MTMFLAGLVLFLANHMIRVIAPAFRQGMIDRIGLGAWRGLYSVVSLVALVMVAYGFDQARATTGMLWNPPAFLSHITLTLMVIATILFVASLLPAGHIRARAKHPMVLSVKIWALAHLIANGETTSVILFAALLAWAGILFMSYRRREAAGEIVRPVFVSAIWDVASVVIGLAVYAAIVLYLHEWLIGVAPIVMGG